MIPCDLCPKPITIIVGDRRACFDHRQYALPRDDRPWWRRLLGLHTQRDMSDRAATPSAPSSVET